MAFYKNDDNDDNDIDVEDLRRRVIDKCEDDYFGGGFGSAGADASDAQHASLSQLKSMANRLGIRY